MKNFYSKLFVGFLFVLGAMSANAQVTISGSTGTANGTYTSFTNASGAFAALNTVGSHNAADAITISVTADVLTEAGTNALNAGTWASITITPTGGAWTISGASVAGTPLFSFNGADNVTINGAGNLTFSNTLASATSGTSTLKLAADATNNTFNNVIMLGSSSMANGTNGGVVFISTGTTTGNDNNSFQSCKFGPAGANLPSMLFNGNGSTTSTAIENSGNTVNNCEFYDYFQAAVGSAAIYVTTGNTNWTITNNKVYQTATRTITTSSTVYGIYVINAGATALGEGFSITGNTIGYNNNAATGTMTYAAGTTAGGFNGIIFSASANSTSTNNINNNIISNIQWTSTSTSVFSGISSSGLINTTTGAIFNINNNTVQNIASVTATGAMTGMNCGYAPTTNIGNNNILNLSRSGSSTLYGIQYAGGATTTVTLNLNTISSLSHTAATSTSAFYGLYSGSSPAIENITNNTINGLTSSSTGGQTICGFYNNTAVGNKTIQGNTVTNLTLPNTSTGTIYGIRMAFGTTDIISGNTVNTLTGGTNIYGITVAAGTTNNIYKNKIYGLSSSVANPAVYGLYITAGTTNNIYNNLIGNLTTSAANSAIPLAGIYLSGGTTNNAYYNSVYLSGTSSGALFGSAAIYVSTTPTVDLRNNIFVNMSTPVGATGFSSAYRRSTATLTSYASTSNNNLFYAGTPGVNNLIYYDGTNSDQTLVAYKTRLATRDAASVTENPTFISTSGASANFLHINPSIATQIESGAGAVAGITDDFDGDVRNVSTPDIGADEGTYTLADISAPGISYTPLSNTCASGERTLTATITDISGVPTSGAGLPVAYFKINGGAYTAVTGTFVSGSTYSFSIGAGSVAADVISYYIVAQDIVGTPNVGSSPSLGAAGFTVNPPAAATAPTTPNSYSNLGSMGAGTYSIGSLNIGGEVGHYATLTAAVADYNTKCLAGNIVFALTDATYPSETFPIVINSNPGADATHTLRIKPDAGVTATISGSAISPLIKLKGASFVTIDGSNSGGTSRDLTITNTSATTPGVLWIGSNFTTAITNVTVKNSVLINGVNTSSAVIISDGTTSGTAGYFNNITLQNNSIQKAYIGVYAVGVVAAGNGSGTLITGNDLNSTGTNSILLVGIYVQGVDGATVSNNNIGNMSTSGAYSPKGIWIATGTNSGTISGNNISSITLTNTGAYAITGIYLNPGATATGISVTNNTVSTLANSGSSLSFAGILSFSPNTNITNNTVSGLTQNAAASFWGIIQSGAVNSNCSGNTVSGLATTTTGVSNGINIQGVSTGVAISKNKIYNIKNSNSGGYTAVALALASSSNTANITASNNVIYDIAAYGYASQTGDNGYGINIYSGGGYNLYYNSVNLATGQTLATGVPACLVINSAVTTANSLDIRNNIFSIPTTVGTNRYAVLSNAANTVFSYMDNNDYFTSGTNIGYITAANVVDLAAWKIATGKDANSQSALPTFTSPTDLHLATPDVNNFTFLESKGVVVSVTTDFDGESRPNGIAPDLGADEFVGALPACPQPTVLTVGSITATSASLSWTSSATSFNIEYGPAGFTPGTGTTVTGVTNPYTLSGLTPNTNYGFYVKTVCEGSTQSTWAGPKTFVTPCEIIVTFPYTQSFSAALGCWTATEAVAGSSVHWVTATADATHGAAGPQNGTHFAALDVFNAAIANNPYYLTSPTISLGATAKQVKYYYWLGSTGYTLSPVPMTLQVSTNGGSTWTDLFAHTSANSTLTSTSTVAGWTQMTIDLTAYSGQTVKLRFASNSNYGSGYTNQGIDEFVVEEIPACPAPTVLTAGSITAITASLGWTSSASTFDIEYGPTGFTPGAGTTVTAVSNPYTLSGLSANTNYSFYVRAICGGRTQSTWSGPKSFVTLCTPASTINENFDAVTAPALPGCWSKYTSPSYSAQSVLTYATSPNSTPNSVQLYSSGASLAADAPMLISPVISNLVSNSQLKFFAKGASTNTSIIIGTMTDPSNPATFTQLQAVTGLSTSAWTEYIVSFASYSGSDQYIAFKHPLTTTYSYVYVDNVVWEAIPACPPPTLLTATGITVNGASLGWTSSAATFDLEYGPAGFTPGTGTTVSGVSNPYALTGLSANTSYGFYVKSNCPGPIQSLSAGPKTFSTACNALNIPYVQNFESVTVPALPNCTSIENAGSGNNWTTFAAPGYGFVSNTLRYLYNGSSAANAWFYTAGLNLTGGTAYTISYKYGGTGGTFPEKLKVYYGSSAASASMTNLIANYSSVVNATPNTELISFTPSASGVYYFGFNAYSAANQFYLFVDDISIVLSPLNNECTSPVTIGTSSISSTNNGATQTLAVGTCGGTATITGDVWYQFTASSNGAATVNVTNVVGFDPVIEVYSGACGAFINLGCANAGGSGVSEVATLSGLVSGQTYFVRVYGTSTSMGTFDISVTGAALPISIEYFKGSKQSNGHLLDWKVACSSSPSVNLELERSADGRKFSAINSQSATATRCLQPFSYTDATPLVGVNYYRLKSIDIDGKITYSTIVALLNKDRGFEMVSLMPNPAKEIAVLSVTSAEKSIMEIVVSDMNGKEISKQRVSLIAGNNQLPLNVGGLASGTYQVVGITADGVKKSLRFVKH